MIGRLRSVNIDFSNTLKRVLQNHEADIAELNREQLRKGKRSDNSDLPDYTPKYAKKKRRPIRPRIMFDTGDFYDGFRALFGEKGFSMDSSDSKNDDILSYPKHGTKVMGLTPESRAILIHKKGAGNEFVKDVKNQLRRHFRNV